MGTILPSLRRKIADAREIEPTASRMGSQTKRIGSSRIVARVNSDDGNTSSESELTDLELMNDLDDLSTDTEDRYQVMDISADEDWDENSVFDLGDAHITHVHATEDDFWEAIYQNNEADLDFEDLPHV